MEGLDVLGAVPFEEYLVGAAVPNEKPTLTKLSKAAAKANAVAAKLARLKGSKAARAVQKLRAHASAASSKGQKLSKAVARARTKAAAALAKPAAKPAVMQAATRAAQLATAPAAPRAAVPARTGAPSRGAVPARSTQAAPTRRGASTPARQGVSVLGALGPFMLQSISNWVGPMLDVYNAFAKAVDDASVAAEVWVQVEPLLDQLLVANPNSPLVPTGNGLLTKANAIIDSVEVPADPPADDSVGWWVGETSYAGASLQQEAIAWIKQARIALGQWGTPAVVVPVPVPVLPLAPPVAPTAPAMPPMNQDSGGGGGGGGGGGDSSEGGGEEEGAAAEEAGPPSEGGEGGEGGEEAPYEDEGEEEYYATRGAGAGVPGATGDYEEDAEYASDEGEYGDETESEEGYSDETEREEETEEGPSALEALALIGHRGGGGGGGHRGGHRGGGHRGMRYGYGGYYGGPWYDGPWGYDVLLEDDVDEEELANKIAKKVAQQQWSAGHHTHVGGYDIQSAQRQMNTLRDVTVAIARVMAKRGKQVALETIAFAQGGMLQRELPGITSLKNTFGHVQWHDDNLAQFRDSTAIYPNSADLKKWVMQAFIDANSVEEARATQAVIWNAMWTEIGEELAKMPPKIVQAIVKLPGQALEAITGVPAWVWWVGGGVLVVGIGFAAWKIITLATPAVAGVAARRYLP